MAHRIVIIVDSATGAMIDVAGNSRETGRYSKFSKRMLSLHKNPQLDYGVNGGDSLTISKNGNSGKEINLIADTVKVSGDLLIGGRTIAEIVAGGGDASILDSIVGADEEISVDTIFDELNGKQLRRISLSPVIKSGMEQFFSLVDNFEETISGVVASINEIVEKTDLMDTDLSTAKEDIASIKSDIESIEENVTTINDALSEANEQISTMSSDVESVKGDIESQGSSIASLEEVVDGLSDGCVKKEDLLSAISDITIGDEDTLSDVRGKLRLLIERIVELCGSEGSDEQEL